MNRCANYGANIVGFCFNYDLICNMMNRYTDYEVWDDSGSLGVKICRHVIIGIIAYSTRLLKFYHG